MASEEDFNQAYLNLVSDVASTVSMENALGGKGPLKVPKPRGRNKRSRGHAGEAPVPRDPIEITKAVLKECNRKRKCAIPAAKEDTSDAALSKIAKFTDKFNLESYEKFLYYVVTLAEAIPVFGSGVTLPLDLHRIAARCKNSYYAPKKFSAVQLAYNDPRCRVLVFHTGRMVGTGCSGPMAARLALMRAQRQLYSDAGVHIHVRNFNVGACSLRATLNCEEFATAHSSTAHFDVKSFVGLAWRPVGEPICCEIYSTGRANLPGSVVERQLHKSFCNMLPELLRFSSASRLLSLIPKKTQEIHRTDACAPEPKRASLAGPSLETSLWDGWGDAGGEQVDEDRYGSSDEDDVDLSAMGL